MGLICHSDALRALHRVLVCTRFEAYEGRASKTLGDVMDSTEYLVALLQNHEGRSEEAVLAEFRAVLQDIEARFSGYDGLVTALENDPHTASEGSGDDKRMNLPKRTSLN